MNPKRKIKEGKEFEDINFEKLIGFSHFQNDQKPNESPEFQLKLNLGLLGCCLTPLVTEIIYLGCPKYMSDH